MADALQHAHDRGILHQDIKPSNILLAADGQPLLLDFNLSRKLSTAQAQASAALGGTVAYMSPEHLRALLQKDQASARLVDRRSDIYSLGMVLYYMLVGQLPFEHKGSYSVLGLTLELMAMERSRAVPSARKKRQDVPWSLESIVRKCLQPDFARRYQKAADLADDLRCFLEDRPLKHAPELSRVERVRKWIRRHPRVTSSGSVATIAILMLCAAGAGFIGVRERLITTKGQLAVVQAQDRKRHFEEGAQRARCLINTTIDMQDNLRQGMALCEKTLGLYDILEQEPGQEHPDWRQLAPRQRLDLAEDARELLLLLAWARVRTDPRNENTLRQALTMLDRAAAIDGLPLSTALWEDRAQYLSQLGDAAEARVARDRAQQIQPASARDHYMLATSYAHNSKFPEAIAELDKALKLQPGHFWSSFQRGLCQQERGNYSLAAGDFGVCIGLWPDFALGYFNRGYALDLGGNKAEAIRDYTAALQHDATFLPAYINRGMALLESQRFEAALEDFHTAAAMGRDDASLHAGRGVALEGLGRHAQADEAFEKAFAALPAAPAEVQTRIHWVYGFAVCGRLPATAMQSFDEVLQHNPAHPQALYGRALLLVEKGHQEQVLPLLNQAIAVDPNFAAARRFRAILLARCGHLDAANQEVNWCLEREPTSGSMFYAAACVASLSAEKAADPLSATVAAKQALNFLDKALSQGYGNDRAATDRDLKAIRELPEFARRFPRAPAAGN
jgi:tetratricopeptide (TPR) repeat protein